ncbi:toprim domain-containing protein [Variovorax sp. PMC12]|uniref:toprim domain-containing protein n=1 Tax=Variovorax sp. PMC12 TaxID=2126319 RepID=UPI0018FECA2D|nr:toprim domain-containing protein [Variovorax sp. PMC12]
MSENLISGDVRALPKRDIREETCAKFGYMVGQFKGETVQIAPYRNKDGDLVAQKLRNADKEFSTLGDFKEVALFGAHLWSKGKKLVVTEGEIDCMTVAQVQNLKWPVVSVPNGAQGAKKAIARNLDYLTAFEEVIFMFDMDEPGIEAAKECAALLPVGKAKIASLPLKDPNELHLAGRGDEIVQAMWNAKDYRPDGLLSFDDVIERIKKPVEWGLPWWDERLHQLTYGRRYREIYTFGAGTGIGKTDWFTQQIAFDMDTLKLQVGLIFLETPVDELGKRIAGKKMGLLFHIPGAGWSQAQLDEGSEWLRGKGHLYDSFGQTDWDVVRGHIRYMATALGIKVFYLDHLTALADTADEKGSLEQIMKELAGVVHELGLILHLVSHLTTPDQGPPHEEGGRVTIRQFKGSRAIGFWSNFMFGMERNQQAEDPAVKQTTTFRVLKDRNTGRATGATLGLTYDRDVGRLLPADLAFPTSPFPAEPDPF